MYANVYKNMYLADVTEKNVFFSFYFVNSFSMSNICTYSKCIDNISLEQAHTYKFIVCIGFQVYLYLLIITVTGFFLPFYVRYKN